MKKPTGRKPNFPPVVMRIIAEKAASGELTYREAARIYQTSHGTVHACKKLYGANTPISFQEFQTTTLPAPNPVVKKQMEADLRVFVEELRQLDEEIQGLGKYRK